MKYYTAFLYKDKSPSELHCTHKYFGELTEANVTSVIAHIDVYLDTNTWVEPKVAFTIKDKFGAKYDTNVLKPAKTEQAEERLLPRLRSILDKFKRDQFKSYRPHVTCDLESLSEPFDRYALVGSGGVIIKEWKL